MVISGKLSVVGGKMVILIDNPTVMCDLERYKNQHGKLPDQFDVLVDDSNVTLANIPVKLSIGGAS